jgi:D-alanyl-D-alanine carboxypeptidase (penicillin-binding protein 5/6)
MHPSSMTKLWTAYMIFDKLKKNIIKLDTKVSISTKAYKMGGSRMYIDPKIPVSVREAITGLTVQSGNDASVLLAEHAAGSEEAFTVQMTQKARELGCTNTTFRNASGWPHPEHLTTARDLDIMLRALIRDFPEYLYFFSIPQFTYNNIVQYNRHPLFDKNLGCDVGKTGFTDLGQYGLMASAKRQDHRGNEQRINIIINGIPSAAERAQTAVRDLVWAQTNFSTIPVTKKDTVITTAPVKNGLEKFIELTSNATKYATVLQTEVDLVKAEYILDADIRAPIKLGQKLGKAVYTLPNNIPIEVDLVANKDVAQAGIFKRMINAMADVFKREA